MFGIVDINVIYQKYIHNKAIKEAAEVGKQYSIIMEDRRIKEIHDKAIKEIADLGKQNSIISEASDEELEDLDDYWLDFDWDSIQEQKKLELQMLLDNDDYNSMDSDEDDGIYEDYYYNYR